MIELEPKKKREELKKKREIKSMDLVEKYLGEANEKQIKAELEKMFNYEDPWNRKDMAWVWTEVKSMLDERWYGRARWIKKSQLKGRKVEYAKLSDGTIRIKFLDSEYDPRTFKWTNPLKK